MHTLLQCSIQRKSTNLLTAVPFQQVLLRELGENFSESQTTSESLLKKPLDEAMFRRIALNENFSATLAGNQSSSAALELALDSSAASASPLVFTISTVTPTSAGPHSEIICTQKSYVGTPCPQLNCIYIKHLKGANFIYTAKTHHEKSASRTGICKNYVI